MRLDRMPVRAIALLLALCGLAAATALAPAAGASAAISGPALSSGALAATPAPVPTTPAPANDERANAQPIRSLPATINGTVVGATLEPGESESSCGGSTVNSVWYS